MHNAEPKSSFASWSAVKCAATHTQTRDVILEEALQGVFVRVARLALTSATGGIPHPVFSARLARANSLTLAGFDIPFLILPTYPWDTNWVFWTKNEKVWIISSMIS